MIKTENGSIFKAQSCKQIKEHLAKSTCIKLNELRAIILPNELWFVNSFDMVHKEMADALKTHIIIDFANASGVFIREIDGELATLIAKHGFGQYKTLQNYPKIKEYPIIKRFGLTVKPSSWIAYPVT